MTFLILKGTDANDFCNELYNNPLVSNVSIWQSGKIKRAYVTLFCASKNYNGDRNTKIYYCYNAKKVVFEIGKGFASSDFYEAVEQLKAQYA